MQEVQVKTGGYEAEFGQATGGVDQRRHQERLNDLRAAVFGYARPTGSKATGSSIRSVERHRADDRRTQLSDAGVEIGGPDRQGSAVLLRRDRSAVGDADVHAPDGFPLRKPRRRRPERGSRLLLGEGHVAADAGHRIDASFFGDPAQGRQRAAAHLVAARDRRPSRFSALELRRPQPDGPLRRRLVAATGWSRRLRAAR